MLSTRKLTLGAMERRKLNPSFDAFGVGAGMEHMRMNSSITMVQRDNIWHPYYEIKLDDEDLGTRFRKNAEAKREKAVDGEAIEQIQQQLQQLESSQRAENERAAAEESGVKNPEKRKFDMKEFTARKQAEDASQGSVKVEDPKAVKLLNLNSSITEEDIIEVMKKFGNVVRCRIPID